MAKFKFRLQSLLAIREAARDERRAQLAEAYAAQRKLQERRDALRGELQKHKDMYRTGTAPGRVNVDELLSGHRYELVMQAEMAVIAQHDAALEAEIERRRAVLVAADREVRVLEKLRERRHEEFRQQLAVDEMKVIDEIATRATVPSEDAW